MFLKAKDQRRSPSPAPFMANSDSVDAPPDDTSAALPSAEEDENDEFLPSSSRRDTLVDDIDADDADLLVPSESERRFASLDSFYTHRSASTSPEQSAQKLDFIHLISEISRVYKKGAYLEMMHVDPRSLQEKEHGSTFRVSRSSFTFRTRTVSSVAHSVSNKLVVKRVALSGLPEASQVRGFISELRILDHLLDNPFIVDLRGVGWLNEFHAEQPFPKPVVILEEAFATLNHLIGPENPIDFEMLFSIYSQVAEGVSALHQCHVAHGDIKPANVLLFKTLEVREGVESYSYIAKLSDFESAVFNTGSHQHPPLGTTGYTAPEIDAVENRDLLDQDRSLFSFEDILKTDVWSLGMLFAVVWCNDVYCLLYSDSPTDRAERIRSRIRTRLENSSAGPELVRVANAIFSHTVRVDPRQRSLKVVIDNLAAYLPHRLRLKDDNSSPLPLSDGENIVISYHGIRTLGGPLKDKIATELLNISESSDSRKSQALWELGVLHLSKYADPSASSSLSLSFVLRAAEAGDVRAMALYGRLRDAFSPNSGQATERNDTWLQQAAAAGHQAALDELAMLGSTHANVVASCQAQWASTSFESVPESPVKHWDVSKAVSSKQDTALHRAAAMGNLHHLQFLVKEGSIDIDAQNLEGDTPLLLACHYGQAQAAQFLLLHDADAKICNNMGENGLHFCWCFTGPESEMMLELLLSRGARADAVAKGHPLSADLDVLPLLPGTPAERAAGRRRFDLVLTLLRHKNIIQPANGNVARRVLIWALRLHDIPLQQLMMQQEIPNLAGSDATLSPMYETTWLHKGEERNLIDAACAGWVSRTKYGWDVPLDFWMACCNGRDYTTLLQSSICGVVEMLNAQQPFTEELLDRSIKWAFRESLYEPLKVLLRLKVESTDGLKNRLQDTSSLEWELLGDNPKPIPAQRIHLIDRIFNADGGTLLQQSILSGDRFMFCLLISWNANPHLPAPIQKGDGLRLRNVYSLLGSNVNAYSLAAHTVHRDLWFAKELYHLEVPLSCPWRRPPFQNEPRSSSAIEFIRPSWDSGAINLPPLLEAVGLHFWEYAIWLLEAGASLEEYVNDTNTLIDVIASLHCRECVSFFFGDPTSGVRAGRFLPDRYRDMDGQLLYRIFFAMCDDHHAIAHIYNGARQPSQNLDCLSYLLKQYPLREEHSRSVPGDRPSHPEPRLWLVEQTARISNKDGDALRLLIETWKESGETFPEQRFKHYLGQSPIDRFPLQVVACILEENDHLDLRNLSPSILTGNLWPSTYSLFLSLAVGLSSRLVFSFLCYFIGWASNFYWLVHIVFAVCGISFNGMVAFPLVMAWYAQAKWLIYFYRHSRRIRWYFIPVQSVLLLMAFISTLVVLIFPIAVFGFFILGWNPTMSPISFTAETQSLTSLCDMKYDPYGSRKPQDPRYYAT